MSSDSLCTMCGEETATTMFFAPVCEPCRVWLEELDADLKAAEAADPEIAEAARRLDAALARVFPERPAASPSPTENPQ